MRDLLYLSENKMRALVPQMRGQLRRRLSFEAGFNAGLVTAKATLPSESQPSTVALLDAVVKMIEREHGERWRTDSGLRAGDWIRFEDEFRYGSAETAWYLGPDDHEAQQALSGLVYFAATEGSPFVLFGSTVHVLDRWQPDDSQQQRVGGFYLDALIVYARSLAESPDETATTEFKPPTGDPRAQGLLWALLTLCRDATREGEDHGWAPGPVRLSGHARVLAVVPASKEGVAPAVLATPLYVEYTNRS